MDAAAGRMPDVIESAEVLERTPAVLDALLRGLPDAWTDFRDTPEAWSARQIVGHLVHGEREDWIPRMALILAHGDARAFEPFDREGHMLESRQRPLPWLLDEFARLRAASLATLGGWSLGPEQLALPGRHPALGAVTLGQLLATWVVHDLGHLRQVARTLARRHADDVGPWRAYLPVLGPPPEAPPGD